MTTPPTGPDQPDPHAPFVDTDDVDGLDLTPRAAPPVGGGVTGRRRRRAVLGVLGVLVVAVVLLAYQGLSNATVFFREADEAVAEREELGDKRFRLHGAVVAGTVEPDGAHVRFVVERNDVQVEVRHLGDPPELFQPDIPVVLEGRWSEDRPWFESDRILVKHSEDYEADNPERTDQFVGDDVGRE